MGSPGYPWAYKNGNNNNFSFREGEWRLRDYQKFLSLKERVDRLERDRYMDIVRLDSGH
jgi:hypothetical protein